jgi:hypothetical protein
MKAAVIVYGNNYHEAIAEFRRRNPTHTGNLLVVPQRLSWIITNDRPRNMPENRHQHAQGGLWDDDRPKDMPHATLNGKCGKTG